MYIVIEFTNDRKEQEIIIHGYSHELHKAVEHATQLCKNQKSVNTKDYIVKIEEKYEDCVQDIYINLKNSTNSKVLHKFFMSQIERTTDKECFFVCDAITKRFSNLKNNDITLHHLLDYFEVSSKHINTIKDDYYLDEQIGHEIDLQKYFIDLFKMKGYGKIKEFLDYEIYYYSQVFGIIQVGSI